MAWDANRTLVVFEVAGRRCAVPLEAAREVAHMVALAPLPAAPPGVEGVVDLRGTLVPVVDVRRRLGLPERPPEPSDHLLFVRTSKRRVALRVDRVLDLREGLPDGPRPGEGAEASLEGVSGVASLDGGLVLVYDLEAFLTEAEEAVLDRALDAVEGED